MNVKAATHTSDALKALHEYRGAYTDLRDLVRLRYAARELNAFEEHQTSNPLAGLLSSSFRGRGIDFAEVRAYQPGDDVRTIDWRVTARTQSPHTKLFQEEKERPVLILVDQSASMYFGSRVTFKSVLAARVAALVGWAALDRGDRVGGIVFSGLGHREVRPRRNKHAVLRLLNELNDANHALSPERETQSTQYFNDALANVRRVTKHGSMIFLISDFQSFMPESRIHLQTLARHNDVIGIHISDALEASLPPPDIYSITDGHQRARINTASKANRQAYEAGFKQRLSNIKDEFLRVKAPLVTLRTDESIVDAINRSPGTKRRRK
ncbi:MAG: hypothetical protein ACI8Z1_001184 [Candidatus Azotimanducaceae bacterium]|jgi:uncharacterized protein (DUF58 family)